MKAKRKAKRNTKGKIKGNLYYLSIQIFVFCCFPGLLWEVANKKVIFLLGAPLRGKGGKGLAIKKKKNFFFILLP